MIGKRSAGSIAFDVVNLLLLTLFGFLCLYPFYYLIIYSVSDPQLSATGITLLPKGFTLSNFKEVMTLEAIPTAALVSVARTVIASLITLICSSFFGYLMTKREMYLRKIIYRFVIITMYVGGGLIPTYLVYRMYGLRNTFWVYIIPGAISAYYVILIKTFIEQLPESLEEAAMIEGAGIINCYLKIVMPLSKPILATIAVFAMVGEWNYWFDSHIYITNEKLYTLQYVLYNYLQKAQTLTDQLLKRPTSISASAITPAAVRMTITLVVTLPVLCVYPFMQRYFVKGIMMGAIKG